jgi:transcription elongation GreA/GreB family factor
MRDLLDGEHQHAKQMSRAFVKEDIDIPERIRRRRTVSGLPPDALNYMTEAGAKRLRQRVAELKMARADEAEFSDLESMLDSATVVKPPDQTESVVFGACVTLRSAAGEMKSCRIVGVDEVHLEPENVSWISAAGKALLGARVGQRVSLEPPKPALWTVVKID